MTEHNTYPENNGEYSRRIELERINTSLLESRENIRLLLDSTAEAIYGVDMEGKCTFCNKSFLMMMGYTCEEELIGKNMHQMIHYMYDDGMAIPQEACEIYKAFINGQGTHREDEVFYRADGTRVPVEYHSYPQIKNGKVVGAVVTFMDITERKKARDEILKANEQLEAINDQLQEKQYALEEQNTLIEELNSQLEDENIRYLQQKEILQAIIDSLGAGILMVDTEGRAMFINNAWKELFSYLDIGVELKPNDNFYINIDGFPNTREIIRSMLYGMENGQEETQKLLELLGDNVKRYNCDLEQVYPVKRFLNIYSNPCISSTNHSFGRVYVIRDISHQKGVDKLKTELISTVSHELRTPMSSILGFSELLLTRELTGERSKEYVGIINSEAKRLTELINDFLDIQRMEDGKQEFSKQLSSISTIIEEALKLFKDNEDIHNIIYNKDSAKDYKVYCDRSKILRVITNLLSNAVKYSPGGGDIAVRMEPSNGDILVSVEDHGLGIPQDAVSKLFTKFYRVDNDDRRKIGGTGLGLAICKEIIKAHDGQIGVNSDYGRGSTFWFTLPCFNVCSNVTEAAVKTDHSSGCFFDLLIIENDISTVKLIKEVLKDEKLKIHDTGSGEEALELLLKNNYKIVLLDIALNGQMSGWDVIREFKKNRATTGTPIVIISAYENKSIASERGINDYLVKPFEPDQLLNAINKALDGKLDSGKTVGNGNGLTNMVSKMLGGYNIEVKHVDHSENILIITLNREEGK